MLGNNLSKIKKQSQFHMIFQFFKSKKEHMTYRDSFTGIF